MKTGEGRFSAGDGVQLFHRWWLPDTVEPAKVLLILHGIALESSPYRPIAGPLAEAGVATYAFDLRGHGQSGGVRGRLRGKCRVLADIDAFVSEAQSCHPEATAYLFGESMGGLFALAYASRHPGGLGGLVLAAPALKVRVCDLVSVYGPRRLLRAVTRPRTPVLELNGDVLDMSCRDDWFKHYRRTDPRPLPAVSLCYLAGIGAFLLAWRWRYPWKLHLPTLIVQGDADRLLRPSGAQCLFRAVRTSDKEACMLPGAYHTLPWDPATPALVTAMTDWLSRH